MYLSRWAPEPPQPDSRDTTSSLSAAASTFAPASPAISLPSANTPITQASEQSSVPIDDSSAPEPAKEEQSPSHSTQFVTESIELSAPPPDVSTVDEFAQTGGGNDGLFDDIIPADESMRVRSDDDLFSDDFTPTPQPAIEQPTSTPAVVRNDQGSRGSVRSRGHGRGGTPRVEISDHTQSHPPSQPTTEPTPDAPESAPKGPRQETVVRSVRGNRQATGGIKKPKLTEAELAEKMAQIQIKNANLTAAHARAEADAATFAQRESQAKTEAAKRQREERRDRQQMMGEREKNRLRKLKAMEGREWDAEKNEQDFGRGGQFDKKGGFTQQPDDGNDGREYLYKEPRGGRRGGGRGSARGSAPQQAPKADDFPSLPGGRAQSEVELEKSKTSWADQVENA